MTPEPKVRFDNSILANPDNIAFTNNARAKAAKADPNATPETSKAEAEKQAKKAEDKKAAEEKKDAKKAADAEKGEAPKPADEAEKAANAPPKAALMYKNDNIGENGYDYSVYDFTNNQLSGHQDGRSESPY